MNAHERKKTNPNQAANPRKYAQMNKSSKEEQKSFACLNSRTKTADIADGYGF
jgi:hypothetical protein